MTASTMPVASSVPAVISATPHPSQVIAEALVERQGPRQIVRRAATLGLSRQLTEAMVVACCATAVDLTAARRPAIAAT